MFDRYAMQNIVTVVNSNHTIVLLLQRIEILQKVSSEIRNGHYKINITNDNHLSVNLSSYYDQLTKKYYLFPQKDTNETFKLTKINTSDSK
jgi:hypothetical protein